MGKLEDYYEFVANMGLDKKNSGKQQEVLKKMEEEIIEEEILPLLSQALSKPISQVKRSLSLIVDYTPNQGVSIKMYSARSSEQMPEPSKYELAELADNTQVSKVADDSDPYAQIKSTPGYRSILMEKDVDWSVLNHGFTIPMVYHEAFKRQYANSVVRGQGADITVILNGKEFPATLREPDMSGGRKVLQILWKGKELVATLRNIFPETYAYMLDAKNNGNGKKQVKLPDNLQHKIIICAHEAKGFYIVVPE